MLVCALLIRNVPHSAEGHHGLALACDGAALVLYQLPHAPSRVGINNHYTVVDEIEQSQGDTKVGMCGCARSI